jgi:formate-nitrite transporter family protein
MRLPFQHKRGLRPAHGASHGGDGRHEAVAEEAQEREIQNRTSPPGEVVYGAVFREGEHELERSNGALAWSGLAAGLSMGFSFVAEGLLQSHLPDEPWAPIVSKLGYAVGFLIVILGRQQLFTKNTLTVILPLLNREAKTRVRDVARLWAIVFVANIVGAFIFAWFITRSNVFAGDPAAREAFSTIGAQVFQSSFMSMFLRAILSGWLIALMIWLLPFAESARIWVIGILAYVIGLGHLPHVIAGSVAAFYHMFSGQVSFGGYLTRFLLPVALGNAVGGVALVAAGVHAEFFLSEEEPGHHNHSSEKYHVSRHSRKSA